MPVHTYDDVRDICLNLLDDKFGGLKLTPDAIDKLTVQIKTEMKAKGNLFGYGHFAYQKAEDIFNLHLAQESKASRLLEAEDIGGNYPPERTIDDILSEIDEFIGMDDLKRTIRDTVLEFKENGKIIDRELLYKEGTALNVQLTGNPGTGKITIARKLGEIFKTIGVLNSGHVVEANKNDLIGQDRGETRKLVDMFCDRALGGILFVNEPYTLISADKHSQGMQALERLTKRMEDVKGRFVVIVAGNRVQMDTMMRINQGWRNLFKNRLHINDYSPEELFRILYTFIARKKYGLSKEADKYLKVSITQLYKSRDMQFTNGDAMYELFEKMCSKHAERISKLPFDKQTNKVLTTFEIDDIPYEEAKITDYSECMEALHRLVGLSAVKDEVMNTAEYLNMQIKHGELASISGKHYIFTGNPGTGKRTVAHIIANMFRFLGVVTGNYVIEADRNKMVADKALQTGVKTNQLIDSALGGVLYINNVEELCTGEEDLLGKRALNTLLKRMQDDRGKFICIIAGRSEKMELFVELMPRLKSRFTGEIHFDDYNAAELAQIFFNLVRESNYMLSKKSRDGVWEYFESIYNNRDKDFGNAGEVHRIFRQATINQNKRMKELMADSLYNPGMMNELTLQDIQEASVDNQQNLSQIMTELDDFVGMEKVKQAIQAMALQVTFLKNKIEQGLGGNESITLNMVLTGKPGTGKTAIARKMGQILQAVGVLSNDKMIKTDPEQVLGKMEAETTRNVMSLCEEAMGGILFIKEAHKLLSTDADGNIEMASREAIDMLKERMENDKGKFIVILAGPQEEMQTFLKAAPELDSRITHHLHIEDYAESELLDIFKSMARKKQYALAPGVDEALIEEISTIYTPEDENFEYGRAVRRLFDNVVLNMSVRISRTPLSELEADSYQLIIPEDIFSEPNA